MDCKGLIKVFVEDKTTKDGKAFKTYRTSVAHKNEDGTYAHIGIDVRFVKDFQGADKMTADKAYTLDLEDAFLDVRAYTKADGTEGKALLLVIQKATCKDAKPVSKPAATAKNGLPF